MAEQENHELEIAIKHLYMGEKQLDTLMIETFSQSITSVSEKLIENMKRGIRQMEEIIAKTEPKLPDLSDTRKAKFHQYKIDCEERKKQVQELQKLCVSGNLVAYVAETAIRHASDVKLWNDYHHKLWQFDGLRSHPHPMTAFSKLMVDFIREMEECGVFETEKLSGFQAGAIKEEFDNLYKKLHEDGSGLVFRPKKVD